LDHLQGRGLVEWHPLQVRSRLYEAFYPRADAFVMPSHAEGFGFTNVEAASFALPVISSPVGAIPEAVTQGVTGLLVPAGEVAALEQAMTALVGDPDRANALGTSGREDFLSRFTMERFRGEVGRVYQQALECR